MSTTLSPATPITAARSAVAPQQAIRIAVWRGASEAPSVEVVEHDDPVVLVERACEAVYSRSSVPAPAAREVIENLVHAGFRDAVVTVLDAGATLRVADHGPGIEDPARALLPGVTGARAEARAVVRGVGGGLPLAAAALAEAGGGLEIADNLGGGTVVTLTVPAAAAAVPEPVVSEAAREILAVLLELGEADPARLAGELGRPRAECGRELAALGHRGLVSRDPAGARRLTEAGASLVATLF